MIEAGSRVGRFRIERMIGQGAMGNVYLAIDPDIERHVAIKIVRKDLADADRREEVETRFLREAKIAGRLQHPNIVMIYDVGRAEDRTFIAMEYVEGRPLSHLLRPDVPLTDAQRFLIARQTAEALAHAHERQVVHRDVKPGNILIRNDGVVKVSDFGIGKLLTGGSDLTQTGMMIGSPSYMSPEQIRGDTLDGRSDVFSLGVVLYEMFTGVRPFPGDTVTSLVYQILHTEPRDPLSIRPDLPPLTSDIVRRALAKKREDRYPGARELLRDLGRASSTPGARDSLPLSVGSALPMPVPTPIPAPLSAASLEAAAAAAAPGATSGSVPTVIVQRRGGAALLFGVAALVLAAAAFLFVVTQGRRAIPFVGAPGKAPSAAVARGSSSSAATSAATNPPAIGGTSAAASTTASSSNPTPPAATSSIASPPGTVSSTKPGAVSGQIGRPKENARKGLRPADTAVARVPATSTAALTTSASPEPPGPPSDEAAPDKVYQTRGAMKFLIRPDQARLSVDGKYVGIADDWDDRGGGKTFPLSPGPHRVKATLPGYRDLDLQIVVAPAANRDVESAGDEMKQISREPYGKIGKINYETEGDVFFAPELASARVVVDGKEVGVGFQFTAAQPLKLSGPMVHDLVLTDGAKSKALRILSASTAGKSRVLIKETLK